VPPEDLLAFVADRVARYKVPVRSNTRISLCGTMPASSAGVACGQSDSPQRTRRTEPLKGRQRRQRNPRRRAAAFRPSSDGDLCVVGRACATAPGESGEHRQQDGPDDHGTRDEAESHLLIRTVQRPHATQQHCHADDDSKTRAVPGENRALPARPTSADRRGSHRAHRLPAAVSATAMAPTTTMPIVRTTGIRDRGRGLPSHGTLVGPPLAQALRRHNRTQSDQGNPNSGAPTQTEFGQELRGSDPGGDQGERRTIPGEKCPLVGVGERTSGSSSRLAAAVWEPDVLEVGRRCRSPAQSGISFLISHWSSHPRLRLGSRTDGLPTVCEPRRTLPRIRLSLTRAQQYRPDPTPSDHARAGDMHARAPPSDESALCTALISSLRGAREGEPGTIRREQAPQARRRPCSPQG